MERYKRYEIKKVKGSKTVNKLLLKLRNLVFDLAEEIIEKEFHIERDNLKIIGIGLLERENMRNWTVFWQKKTLRLSEITYQLNILLRFE